MFHLYRGSELLQDNRVHEAKQELEQALSLQPRDAKGQDLLAIVYFRLGLYPRAISIYESLIATHPHSGTPRVNLALCYLKTGQAAGARVELERVLELNPRHSRAWGYLGLAFQRLGDYERAYQAFVTGGHEVMARRLADMVGVAHRELERSVHPDAERERVGLAATQAFEQISRTSSEPGEFHTDRDEPSATPGDRLAGRSSGRWAAVEPGRDTSPDIFGKQPLTPSLLPSLAPSESLLPPPEPPTARKSVPPRPQALGEAGETIVVPRSPGSPQFDDIVAAETGSLHPRAPSSGSKPPSGDRVPSMVPPFSPPELAEAFGRKMLLLSPRLHRAALHPSGLVVLKVTDACAVRLDMVRALSFPSGSDVRVMSRRTQGKDLDEPLGGPSSPMFEVTGSGEVILGPVVGARLSVISISGDPITVREGALTAFDGSVLHESSRFTASDGEAVPMVELRSAFDVADEERATVPAAGSSVVVVSLPLSVAAIEVSEARPVLLRTHVILGWTGRVTPRNVPPSEAPGRSRGFIALHGVGMVFVDGR